jgi:U32 family peptidase
MPKEISHISSKKEKLIGEIVHYFAKVEVAVIKLSAPLSIEDSIRVIGGEKTDFKQKVKSMEVEHKKIKKAKKGDEIGMKIKEKVREGYKVYKI